MTTTSTGPTQQEWRAGLKYLQKTLGSLEHPAELAEDDGINGSENGSRIVLAVIRSYGGDPAKVPVNEIALGNAMFLEVQRMVNEEKNGGPAQLHWVRLPHLLAKMPKYAGYVPQHPLAQQKPKPSSAVVEAYLEEVEKKLNEILIPHDNRWSHIRAYLRDCRSGDADYKLAGKALAVFCNDKAAKKTVYDGSSFVKTTDLRIAIFRFHRFRSGLLTLQQYADGD